jgi:transcriptional regulator with XRE-family HTH domain
MRSSELSRFNKPELYAALDAQRRSRGISWQQAAREIGVAPSTLARTKQRGPMEADGMLAMVRWLGRTPESFMRGPSRIAANSEFSAGRVFPASSLRYQGTL